MRRPASVLAVLAVLGAVALLAGCGASGVRGFLADTYDEQRTSGDTVVSSSPDPVDRTAAAIAGEIAPVVRAADNGSEFLRYDEDIVVVEPDGSGSSVRVEDLDGAYRNGEYRYLGPGFDPGSPEGDIDDDVK